MYKKLEFSESYEPRYKQKTASIANAIADSVARPLGKQVRHFRFIFTSCFARGKNKQKMLKSPRTSTPGERSEVTLILF